MIHADIFDLSVVEQIIEGVVVVAIFGCSHLISPFIRFICLIGLICLIRFVRFVRFVRLDGFVQVTSVGRKQIVKLRLRIGLLELIIGVECVVSGLEKVAKIRPFFDNGRVGSFIIAIAGYARRVITT